MGGDAIATAHFVEFCDRLFDSFNGVLGIGERGKELKCRISKDSPHHTFWDDAYSCIDGWKFVKSYLPCKKYVRPPSQNGWLTTITGIRLLWRKLSQLPAPVGKTITYIVPRSINQDALENAFCSIRSYCGSNSNPNVVQFVSALKTCIINGLVNQDVKLRANCEQDNSVILSNLKAFLLSEPSDDYESVICNEPVREGVAGQSFEEPSHELSLPNDWTSTAYVSGFIARRLLRNSTCNGCKEALLDTSQDNANWCTGFFFKEYSDNTNRLTYPSENFIKSVGHSATILENQLELHFHKEKILETITRVILSEVDFTWLTNHCNYHCYEIMKETAKSVCKIGIPWWCKIKNREINK